MPIQWTWGLNGICDTCNGCGEVAEESGEEKPDGWDGIEGNQDRLNVWVCPKCGCETTTRGSTKGKVACIECGHVIHEADE